MPGYSVNKDLTGIDPPIECEVGEEVVIPKQVFPFNESYLKFALFMELEKRGIEAYLEPKVKIVKQSMKAMDVLMGLPPRTYITSIEPDILLPAYKKVWEFENFWKPIDKIMKHASEYSQMLGLESYAITWATENLLYLVDKLNLALVNPISGQLIAPSHMFSEGPPPSEDIHYERGLILADGTEIPVRNLHTWIQYELFKWLRGKGFSVSTEVAVSPSGHVFSPNELIISERRGISEFVPYDFTPYKGWSSILPSPIAVKEVPLIVDIIGYHQRDEKIVGYEVKTFEDFKNEGRILKTLNQVQYYVNTGLFDEFWLTIHDESGTFSNELARALEKMHLSFGVLTYSHTRKTFTEFRRAESLPRNKPSYLKIKVIE